MELKCFDAKGELRVDAFASKIPERDKSKDNIFAINFKAEMLSLDENYGNFKLNMNSVLGENKKSYTIN